MLKKLILENWKSFRYAELDIDPLTILIGTNASGKSNAIDALIFLQQIVQSQSLQTALAGASIRGGIGWDARQPETQFTLKVLVGSDDEYTDYLYSLTVVTSPHARSTSESLVKIKQQMETDKNPDEVLLFQAEYKHDYGILVKFLPEQEEFMLEQIASPFSILATLGVGYVRTSKGRPPSTIRYLSPVQFEENYWFNLDPPIAA
jgi:predicted ATPase